jgi:hypothetical protein
MHQKTPKISLKSSDDTVSHNILALPQDLHERHAPRAELQTQPGLLFGQVLGWSLNDKWQV